MFPIVVVLCFLGLAGGMFLLRSIPVCPPTLPRFRHRISVIIPARNEEKNLPRLLESIRMSSQLLEWAEVIVVDDDSVDETSAVANRGGARVVVPGNPPLGWTGKTWACAQGAKAAQGDLFLFLDADTWFAPEGLRRLLSAWEQHSGERIALSLLPFHATSAPYEMLSVFFNLLMAFGAGLLFMESWMGLRRNDSLRVRGQRALHCCSACKPHQDRENTASSRKPGWARSRSRGAALDWEFSAIDTSGYQRLVRISKENDFCKGHAIFSGR